jgi:hypothetical protein
MADADVTLKSCDNVLFKVRRRQLEANSGAFAGGEAFPTNDEIVHLTEPAAVLDLLLQYVHNQPPPDLEEVDFKVLMGLADAARKYEVYPAIHWSTKAIRCASHDLARCNINLADFAYVELFKLFPKTHSMCWTGR